MAVKIRLVDTVEMPNHTVELIQSIPNGSRISKFKLSPLILILIEMSYR